MGYTFFLHRQLHNIGNRVRVFLPKKVDNFFKIKKDNFTDRFGEKQDRLGLFYMKKYNA